MSTYVYADGDDASKNHVTAATFIRDSQFTIERYAYVCRLLFILPTKQRL